MQEKFTSKVTCAGCGGTDLIELPGTKSLVRMKNVGYCCYVCRDCGLEMKYYDTNGLKKVERLPDEGK